MGNHHVLFVTVAFAIGIDCNGIRRIVHTGVRYTRLGGLAEMALQLGLTLIIIHTRSHAVLCPVQGM